MRDQNIQQVKAELNTRNVNYNDTHNWTDLLNLLKANEGNQKYFKPLTPYESFIMKDDVNLHEDNDKEDEKVMYSRLRRDDNINAIQAELQARNIQYDSAANWAVMINLLKQHEGN